MALSEVTKLYALQMYFKSANQGWSEKHYLPGTSQTALKTNAKTLVDYRLAILPPTCSLVYAKYSELAKERDSIPMAYSYPTAGTWPGDPFVAPAVAPEPGSLRIEVSQIAVLVRVWNVDGIASSRWIHGIPDNRISAEVLNAAIVSAIEPPPPIGDAGFSTSWVVRAGYYLYLLKTLTVVASKRPAANGVPRWYTDVIDDMIVRGVSVKKTGAPFGQQRGHVPIGN